MMCCLQSQKITLKEALSMYFNYANILLENYTQILIDINYT